MMMRSTLFSMSLRRASKTSEWRRYSDAQDKSSVVDSLYFYSY